MSKQEFIDAEKEYVFGDWQLAIAEDQTNLRRLTDKLVDHVHKCADLAAELERVRAQLLEAALSTEIANNMARDVAEKQRKLNEIRDAT